MTKAVAGHPSQGGHEPGYWVTLTAMAELIIENVSQLVTLAGAAQPRAGAEMRELGIIIGGALLARDGVIVAVGAASEVEPQAGPDAIRIDARKSVVMPGFVDAHTHPVFAGT